MNLQQIELHFNEVMNLATAIKEHARALHKITKEEILQVAKEQVEELKLQIQQQ